MADAIYDALNTTGSGIEGDPFTGMPWPGIDPTITTIKSKLATASGMPSPIIFDLDGDGVETTAVVHGSAGGAHFDHAADGFAEQTGWVGKDDGLLVRDLDGDGLIESGRELFGSETLLANGSKAANGFAALAELDTNHDDKIDASDAAYATLRVWKDADSDGTTDAGELVSLADAGVQSINVGYTTSSAVDANGNQHRQAGSYTTTTGSTRTATDVWFKTDQTFSVATEWLDVPDDIAVLPDAKGYGKVYDLHQAMVRDGTGVLKWIVTQFTQASTASERSAWVQNIIYHWTGVQTIDPGSRAPMALPSDWDTRKIEALEQFMGEEWTGQFGANVNPGAVPQIVSAWGDLVDMVWGQLTMQSHLKPYMDSISVVVDGTGVHFDTTQMVAMLDAKWATDPRGAVTDMVDLNHFAAAQLTSVGLDVQPKMLQWLRTMADDTSLWTAQGAAGMYHSNNTVGSDGADIFIGSATSATFNGGLGNDQILGGSASETFDGGAGDDTIEGGDGHDVITDYSGTNVLKGGAGNDVISGHGTFEGGQGYDTIGGNSGLADTYIFNLGDGMDSITEAGLGSWQSAAYVAQDDTLRFGAGINASDISLLRYGNNLTFKINATDSVSVLNWFASGQNYIETVRFADNTVWDLNKMKTLAVTYNGTAAGETITGWDGVDLLSGLGGNDIINGLAGNDTLNGGAGDDTISGGAGADQLFGEAGNDNLNGGDGDDTIDGGDGHDVITDYSGTNVMRGGAGNDIISGHGTIEGGQGYDTIGGNSGLADTYIFNLGDGMDSITEAGNGSWLSSAYVAQDDTLRFGAGINASDISLLRYGNNLTFKINATDSVSVLNWFASGQNYIETVRFADNTVWDLNKMKTLAVTYNGTAAAETINGGDGVDLLNGLGGNDVINGLAGNDVLDGGAGADILAGGTGNDTYQMGLGYGADTVQENDGTVNNTDVLQFLSGIATDQLWFTHTGNNLEVSIIGTTDKATLTNWYLGNQYHVEQFKTSDGKTLLDSQVHNLVSAMAAFAPPAAGQTTLPANYAASLQPVLAANWQ